MVTEFRNEAFLNFSDPSVRAAQEAAIALVESRLGEELPLVIGGKEICNEQKIASLNPSDPSEVIGYASAATVEQAKEAVEVSHRAFASWSRTNPLGRARILMRAANIMRRRRMELSAWMMMESGKNWPEADGDVAEAIDFCDFYAREALRWFDHQPVTVIPGEDSNLSYIPLGVAVVIPPWNFPLAITCGMTVAALVTGNTVVLKPASPSFVIAYRLMEVLREAGLPEGVVQYCPGSGAAIGDALVGHPKTRLIAFTGSKEVGLHINELAAKTMPGQIWIKRVIAEMGGKDATVVDENCDLMDAATGIVAGAFGFQGQKCSACSRAIILDSVYDKVVDEVVRLTGKLQVGDAKKVTSDMGPVVTESAMKGILNYIEIGKKEAKLLCGGNRMDRPGYFIEPTVFSDVLPGAKIEQEEIFGPVLACIRAKDFDHALEIANGTEYGLTGALYSRNRAHLERARREFHVGNLYLNRKCTGALVGVHPFGGFNMSGTDSKAGGRDYLGLFLQAKSVSEKI